MSDAGWAEDFNYDRFARFENNGMSPLNLSVPAKRSEEYLARARELIEPELARQEEHKAYYEGKRSRDEAGRYRNCVDESARAVQCVTGAFINALWLCPDSFDRAKLERGLARYGDSYETLSLWPSEFPVRVAALAKTDVLPRQSALFWANGVRKAVIHYYKNPSLAEALAFLSIATMYCTVIVSKLQWVCEEIELVSPEGESVKISFRPSQGLIWYEYQPDLEALRSNEDFIAETAELDGLRQQFKEAGGSVPAQDEAKVAKGAQNLAVARRFVDVIRSSAPAPEHWKGDVEFTDVKRYRNWLRVILAWAGRTE